MLGEGGARQMGERRRGAHDLAMVTVDGRSMSGDGFLQQVRAVDHAHAPTAGR